VLHQRLLSAAILLSLTIGLIWLDMQWSTTGRVGLATVPLLFFFTLGTIWEFSTLLNRKWAVSPSIVTWHGLVALAVGLYPVWYSLIMQKDYPSSCPLGRVGWCFVGIMTGIGLSGLHALSQFGGSAESDEAKSLAAERTTLGWLLSSFIICYVVGCMLIWHVIRMRGTSSGLLELIALAALTKLADTGAYFTGKTIGRTKLIPHVSPGKTIEGVIGGAVFSIVASYVAFRWVLPQFGSTPGPTLWGPAVLGLLMTLVGLVGDLVESMVKRTVGAKDSGAVLPGLGGVWDVTDSLLPTSIVGYLGLLAQLT
jgi:phosphatidate cytidylyltransferase